MRKPAQYVTLSLLDLWREPAFDVNEMFVSFHLMPSVSINLGLLTPLESVFLSSCNGLPKEMSKEFLR